MLLELNMKDAKLPGKPLTMSGLAGPPGAKQKDPQDRRLGWEVIRNLLGVFCSSFLTLPFSFSPYVSLYLERLSLCNKLNRVLKEGVPGFEA